MQHSIDSRFNIIHNAFSAFGENPAFGIGLGNFAERHDEIVHNTTLWLAAELGVVGLIVFVGLMVWVGRRLWWAYNKRLLDDPGTGWAPHVANIQIDFQQAVIVEAVGCLRPGREGVGGRIGRITSLRFFSRLASQIVQSARYDPQLAALTEERSFLKCRRVRRAGGFQEHDKHLAAAQTAKSVNAAGDVMPHGIVSEW